ncbi:MAG: family 10 glycosylhydrolase [Pirellulales bacterium]|nr:family 10 glycosylhydrolase [Pirellulales bacterium]
MIHRNHKSWLTIALAAVAALSTWSKTLAADVPSPPREFRAAWIATVANIDWPSKKGLPTAQQKKELTALFDKAVDLNLNAVVLQIRPSADAMYPSKLEPWSEYLAGETGKPPKPFYDPLKFAVDEAHRRGLQLHVWFNPYRVRQTGAKSEPTPDHASVADAKIVRDYGPYKWFDPGEPEALKRFIDVVTDVVKRYDVDGIHIDDYFYPYPIQDENKNNVPFPDDESYQRAVDAGETLGRDDWRRQNCDRLVEQMYKAVKQEKPHVLVGISPFGIWRPGHPEGIQGLDQYATLYADARKWLREGWVDYFTPQLYWRIEGPQSYPKLLAWWNGENVKGRHLWPGNGAHNVRSGPDVAEGRTPWAAEELIRQIELTREIVEQPGNVHFSMKCLVDNRDGLTDKLKSGVYAEPALVPEVDWLGGKPAGKPEISAKRNSKGVALDLKPGKGEAPSLWVVRVRAGSDWTVKIVPGGETRHLLELKNGKEADEVFVSAVTRLGQESPLAQTDVK